MRRPVARTRIDLRVEFSGVGSRFLFPAPVRALLPIGCREAQTLKLFPLCPRSREFLGVVAVEEGNRARIIGANFRAI